MTPILAQQIDTPTPFGAKVLREAYSGRGLANMRQTAESG
jgi:hypothetical protein